MALNQWRTDEAEHTVEVSVTSTSATPILFQDVQVVTASFRTIPPARVDTTLSRTPRTDLRIPYGEARCDPDKIPAPTPVTVVAHVQVGGGALREVKFAAAGATSATLQRMIEAECGGFILRQAADVTFDSSWRQEGGKGGVLYGSLTVTRKKGDEPFTVDELGNTTHFSLLPHSGKHHPVAVLAADQATLQIPVEVRPARCDPHAFGEAKKAYIFPVWGRIGDGKLFWMIITPDAQLKAAFLAYAEKACGITT
ncbi:hypothetical protein J5X84_04725 [Streptosporangiaceae bacterium NEAU-GS5]|nr:hypothetical protein [Streptosporangiaceae bacterium NEAU-GS5]